MNINIYFQYTHFTNQELAALRIYLNSLHSKAQLLSSANVKFIMSNILFGKLMSITISAELYNDTFISEILQRFTSLTLLFILFYDLIFTLDLFNLYMFKYKLNSNSTYLFSVVSTLSSISYLFYCINLYKLKYKLLSSSLFIKGNVQSKIPTLYFY